MTVTIDIGNDRSGQPVPIDLQELLATRLLVQGNSGSGKSHLLRRLLEESAGSVQQVVIDPEGDFVTLAEPFGHSVIEAADYGEREIGHFAARVREHRASVVLNLEDLDVEAQMRCAATFLSGLFDAPREQWYPVLVVVDEAQLFAPAGAGDVSDDVRRTSLAAMTNLMCRGRKRGLAGVIATQRLAKLAKNVAAEASNFLMGRTFLDIDMARAADLLGMERRQAEAIRDLDRGSFLALGPAISRRPVPVKIGAVRTQARGSGPSLAPLPTDAAEVRGLIFAPVPEDAPLPAPPPRTPVPAETLLRRVAQELRPAAPVPEGPPPDPEAVSAIIADVLDAMLAEEGSEHRTPSVLFQDFQVRCRMAGLASPPLDLDGFSRRLSCARAGIANPEHEDWRDAMALADTLPAEMVGAFLLIAHAARERLPCPEDTAIAAVYGTSSLGRVRRLLGYMESTGLIVSRNDLSGNRTISIPQLGCATAPSATSGPRAARRRLASG
jgi:hypothetical protein